MMEKRYQVFVSSTYNDLKEERQEVIAALIKRNCFPVAMEYFPAMNRKSIDYIKEVIQKCDFYILIVAGRYGSSKDESGKSLTEIEFDYAQELGIPTNIYLYNGQALPADKIEDTDAGKAQLKAFIDTLKATEYGYATWSNKDNLASEVKDGIEELKRSEKAVGWVRADNISRDQPQETNNNNKGRGVCLQIAEKFFNDIDFDNWHAWTSFLTSADGPSITIERERSLNDVVTYIKYCAIWPQEFPEIKRAFINFANVLADLLKQFHKYSEIQGGNTDVYVTRKFYKELDYNPNYSEDIKKFTDHLEIMSRLTFELTRSVNYICTQIRYDLDVSFKAVEGKRTITNGMEECAAFFEYLPEYKEEQIKSGKLYPGLEQFLKDNGL